MDRNFRGASHPRNFVPTKIFRFIFCKHENLIMINPLTRLMRHVYANGHCEVREGTLRSLQQLQLEEWIETDVLEDEVVH